MTDLASRRADLDKVFRWAAVLFGVALLLHGADHLRRGMAVTPPAVMVAGMIQVVLAAVTVTLVFAVSRWAPHAAIAVGFASAAGFTAAHLLPAWGPFSDSFIHAAPEARITTFSWVTAVLEIAADIAFGVVGIAVLQARNTTRRAERLDRKMG